ncbi:MAG: rRNA maturation RNase YbeY [Phycisphaerales bacterium]
MDDRPARDADDSSDRPPSAGGVVIDLIGPRNEDALLATLRADAHRLAGLLALQGVRGEARTRLVHDDDMATLHERHKRVPGTTDVLTFDLADEPGTVDADIVLCVDEARRQADARGHTVERELMLYLVHGILHCLGHDDDSPASADAMHRREDELLEAIGLGPVFARPELEPGAAPERTP